ncbi:MAG TPA: YjgN family protein [Vicinamibacterales bacterium]
MMQPGSPTLEDAGVVPALPEDAVTRYEPFTFTGSGDEYFGIWIVNLVLSVATLGIYSAWAKVRRLEYFYRHTRVSGASFDYHGKPLAILKGRIFAFLLFGGYYVAGYISPALGLLAAAAMAAVLPWLLTRSLRFRLYNSSYRGLRFHFHGTPGEAYWVFLALPVLSFFSLFTLVPLAHHRLKRFQHANASYGQTRFTYAAPVAAFYKAYLMTALALAVLTVVTGFVVGLVVGLGVIGEEQTGDQASTQQMLLLGFFIVMYALGATVFWSLMTVQIRNIVWRHTSLGPHRFISTLEVHKLLAIVVTNVLGIACTLGLFKPYAEVRLAKYVIGELSLVSSGTLDEFVAGAQPETAALGEEAAELLDVDFGI